MSDHNITYLTDVFLLTCVVQTGLGEVVLKAARDVGARAGAISHHARGIGARERLGLLGIAVEAEKEVITIVVANDQADRIFERMYLAGKLDTPGMGLIYLTPLEKVATYVPPDILARLRAAPETDDEAAGQ